MTDKELLRRLKGRRIVNVELHKFRDGRGHWTYDPTFVLDNGSRLFFSVDETDVGRYGIQPLLEGGPNDNT